MRTLIMKLRAGGFSTEAFWGITTLVLLSASLVAAQTASPTAVKYDAGAISGLTARNIGSATMSGRIAAVDAVDEDGKVTVFVGSASGGVWKSINGGTT
ncbi:MAG TPA: hypothetical protein VF493_16270, partial [Terriglobales bacterium]